MLDDLWPAVTELLSQAAGSIVAQLSSNKLMKTIRNISVLILLLVVAPGLCFAEMLLDDVSRERAKPLGMEIRDPEKGNSYP